jgi:uncharacterized protein YjbJ (UPF0337 family)
MTLGIAVHFPTGNAYLTPDGSFDKGDVMAGEVDKAKGSAKKAVGELTGNEDLKREGEIDQASGKVKEAVEKVADKAQEAVHKK